MADAYLGIVVLASILVVVNLLPMLLTFVVGLWEKRQVWPYEPLHQDNSATTVERFDPSNPYAVSGASYSALQPTELAAKANAAADAMGFRYLGAFRHRGGPMYQLRYDFWISAEHEVLAIVGGGKLATVRVDNIWLHSQPADGPALLTITSHTAGEYDLSGLTSELLISKASFAQAVHGHLQRLSKRGSPALNYSDRPLDDLYRLRTSCCEQLERRGYIRFIDPEKATWAFTFLGSAVFAVKGQIVGTLRLLLPQAWME
jgi:hypothetical protein